MTGNYQNLKLYCSCVLLFVIIAGCGHSESVIQGRALDKQGFQKFFGEQTPIYFKRAESDSRVKFEIEYLFEKSSPYQHYIVEVEFDRNGSMLDQAAYQKALAQSEKSRNPLQHLQYFPQVGLRAQYQFLGAGPGGASEQLVFTSTNLQWDIKISMSHLLPDNITGPERSISDLASYIDQSISKGNKP